MANASSTFQNITFVNATGTQATTTNFFSTALTATNAFLTNVITGGDTINEFAGTGLTVTGNALTATLGTSIDISGETNLTATSPIVLTGDDLACATCALTSTTITIAGTANQITSSAGAQDLSANRTWTLSIPADFRVSSTTLSGSTLLTNATSTNFAITDLFTFNGVVGNSWDDFCTTITGGAGLCDGTDATGSGGGGVGWATTTSQNESIYFYGLKDVGIGTSTPNWTLQVASATPSIAITDSDAAANSKHYLLNNNGGVFSIGTSSDSLTSTSSLLQLGVGTNSGFGTTSPWRNLSVVGTVGLSSTLTSATGGSNQNLCINSSSFEVIRETTSVCAVSSILYKKNIENLNVSALEAVSNLQPVSFSYKEDSPADYNNIKYGLIAEQVASVDPHFAEYGSDGSPRNIDDRAIQATLIKAVQEQQKAINDLDGVWIKVGFLIMLCWNLWLTFRKRYE